MNIGAAKYLSLFGEMFIKVVFGDLRTEAAHIQTDSGVLAVSRPGGRPTLPARMPLEGHGPWPVLILFSSR